LEYLAFPKKSKYDILEGIEIPFSDIFMMSTVSFNPSFRLHNLVGFFDKKSYMPMNKLSF